MILPQYQHYKTMINKKLCFIIFLIANFCISSCITSRNLVYVKDLEGTKNYSEVINNQIDTKIQSDDQLSITVSTLNPESNILFNNGVLPTSGSASAVTGNSRLNEGYLVDKDGFINFPILGKVQLAGLTKEQATTKMTGEINKSVKNPIVNIRFINFRITVLGEVNRPSIFTIANEKINVLEALALAGDLTSYGKRESVMIIREADGIRSITRVNLASKSMLNSPDFYLHQNDILYVEPAKIKALQGSSATFYLTLAATGITILSFLSVVLK